MITITVGKRPNDKVFYAHKGLLCYVSDYFRAALRGSFKEAREKKVHLSEDSVEVFRAFHNLIYTSRLHDGTTTLLFRTLSEIFAFGEARGIPILQNAAVNEIIFSVGQNWQHTCAEDLIWIYNNTANNSPLRRLWADIFATLRKPEGAEIWLTLKDDVLRHNTTFLVDVLIATNARLGQPGDFEISFRNQVAQKIDVSKYHIHGQGDTSNTLPTQ